MLYFSSSPVCRFDGAHSCAEIEISGRQLRERDVVLLRPELVDPAFRQRDPHRDVLARNLTPCLRVRVGNHHVSSDLHLQNSFNI